MTKIEFMNGIHILQDSYNQQFSKEKLITWWLEFKDIDLKQFIEAIRKLTKKNKFMPNVAELRFEIMNNQSFSNYNLNSSYWYSNLRGTGDYYDITKGPEFLLEPFKG